MRLIIATFLGGALLVTGGSVLASDKTAPSKALDGKALYQAACATCHGAGRYERGLLPGTSSLTVKYKGAIPAVLEERNDLAPELTKYVIRHGSGGMPPFRKTEISDRESDAIAAYLAPRPSKKK